MSSDFAIKVESLSKCYQIYDRPQDRLKQMLVRGRKQYYRDFWALKDVSFEIKKGETVGIIGRNGSGKSTLLQMICGTLNPTSGSVQTNGRIAALLELGSGFNPEFTGRENVYMNASLLGLSRSDTVERFNSIENFAEIGNFIDQPVKTYSSGMLVRLAFAVIAHVDADILVIDEALAVGDIFFTQKCMRFLRDFMKTGSIVFVSHDSAAVVNLCKSAIWLQDGAVCMAGSPDEVSNAYLAARYGVAQTDSTTQTQTLESKSDENAIYEKEIDVTQAERNSNGEMNRIRAFSFDNSNKSFGIGGATISKVELLDVSGKQTISINGGEYVSLRIIVLGIRDIEHPIVGFFVKDRLGQIIFGENSFIKYKNSNLHLLSAHQLKATFSFRMPILPIGSYSVDAAIASGDDLTHVQIEWKHDVMVIESISSSTSTGLVGVPMRSISLEIQKAQS
jgi:lipopolysaccharide transport system ATP-binding protein